VERQVNKKYLAYGEFTQQNTTKGDKEGNINEGNERRIRRRYRG
jgi:hypothetical protein